MRGREVLGEGLIVVAAGLIFVVVVGDYGLSTTLGLVLVAVVLTVPFAIVGWVDRRRERDRLAREHGLPKADARMVMQMVDPGVDAQWGMREPFRSAARDYAQRELDRAPTPIWKLAVGVALVAVLVVSLAVANFRDASVATAILTLAYLVLPGYQAYRAYQRPARMRTVLQRLGAKAPER